LPRDSNTRQDQLCVDFPQTHLRHIRRIFKSHNRLYAPTWIYLDDQRKNGKLPKGNNPSVTKGKGKATVLENADFEAERTWVLEYQESKAASVDVDPPIEEEEQVDESGEGIECGCCFASYSFVR
jgi:TRIAD3 protein (E3 ubiquitin-protein ligase RNF216)